MKETFKRLFFRFGKKIFLTFVSFAVLGALFVPQPVFAGFWDWIVGAITFLPNLVIIIFLQLQLLILGTLSSLAGEVLKWILSPGFISWSYTGLDNPVIEIGLNITQSFVNMALVLVLIYIAFSTILRLGGAQTQKLLVTLIIVALLVNFAPVICGIIVDASNIVMYYFTDHITGFKNMGNIFKGMGDRLVESFTTVEATKQYSRIAESLVLITFHGVFLFILLLFVILFTLRYVAIWTAVILAPLAFVCYIVPATRRFFDLWWKQFTQWCILGITAGFFLYLGEQIAELLPSAQKEAIGSEYGIFDAILPHFVTLAFLLIGLIMALTSSAQGATQIISGAKKGGKVAGARIRDWTAKIPKAAYVAPIRGAWHHIKTRGIEKAARGTERPISPSLILEEGLEAEELRQRYKPPSRTKTVVKETGKALSFGLKKELGLEGREPSFKGIVRTARSSLWKMVKDTGRAMLKKTGRKKGESCPDCGKELEVDAKFCPSCGTQL
jgi:hypothetical protein